MSMEDIFSDAGREILDSVNRAIDSNNYSQLGAEITKTVNRTAGIVKDTMANNSTYQSTYVNAKRPIRNTPPMTNTPVQRNYTYPTTFRGSRTPFMPRFVSNGGNIAKSIVGGIGTFGLGVATLSMTVAGVTFGMVPGLVIGLSTVGVLWLSSMGLFRSGLKGSKLLSRYRIYNSIVGDQEYITIDHLSKASGFSTKQVMADLKRLHMKNYIPYAAFDKQRTTLMLTDNVYKEYLNTESKRLAMAKEEQLAALEADREQIPSEVQDVLREGNDYLLKVRNYNDLIPDDQAMSDKLYALEDTMKRIFDKVKEEPKSAKDLRRFMTYYLPTTEKILGAYVAIQNQGGDGENARNTRHEIEDAMDVINNAFATLLDQLFQKTAWDVSSDISVMKTMMAQDGLTDNAMAEMRN